MGHGMGCDISSTRAPQLLRVNQYYACLSKNEQATTIFISHINFCFVRERGEKK